MNDLVRDFQLAHCIETFYTGGSVEWSADGRCLFTTCSNIVKALNVEDASTRYIIGDPDESSHVTCAQRVPNSNRLIVAYSNGLLVEYALPILSAVVPEGTELKPTLMRQWKSTHTAPIKIMKFSPDSEMLATGSADFAVKVWKLDSQCCVASLKGTSAVTEALFVDADRILIGYMDGMVNSYRLKGEKNQIVSILLLNATTAATISRDQTIALVNVETNEKMKTLPLFEPVESAVLMDDGTMLTVGEEGILKSWQPTTGKLLKSTTICRYFTGKAFC
ncbi:unnamed protein product [Anisakis simplex]|uniref:WD_REPEATS_REGION domain-containing protein n=1 Tax=Anisakis simplex TaxID=6269 RepID=A0A0M3J185_ANISI|nr:unnamed protein product [Anisakis simplex]